MPASPAPPEAPLAHFEARHRLSAEGRAALRCLPLQRRAYEPGRDLERLEGAPSHCHFLLEGWVARYALLDEGCRQILTLHLPGEVPDLDGLLLQRHGEPLCALTPVMVGSVPHAALRELGRAHPELGTALWATIAETCAIQQGRIASLGRRPSPARLAHFLCETYLRLERAGLARDLAFVVPMTQYDLADTLGMTNVHINRVLQELRRSGSVAWQGRKVTILDWDALSDFCGFDPAYLGRVGKPPPPAPGAAAA